MGDRLIKIEEFADEDTVYSFGDGCLYEMTKKVLENPDKNKIASMIWLIGRSYAASPERITKAIDDGEYKNNKDKMPEMVFEKMAEYIVNIIVNDEKYEDIKKDNGYFFDYSDQDIKKLCNTIELVHLINESKKEINRATNMISFSSKFMHFCMPNSVFIIDQYSRKGISRIFGSRGKKEIQFDDDCINKYKELNKKIMGNDIVNKLIKDENGNSKNDALRDYIRHVCGCYLLAKQVSKNRNNEIKEEKNQYSIPRIVDSFLVSIGKNQEEKNETSNSII